MSINLSIQSEMTQKQFQLTLLLDLVILFHAAFSVIYISKIR